MLQIFELATILLTNLHFAGIKQSHIYLPFNYSKSSLSLSLTAKYDPFAAKSHFSSNL